MPVQHLQSRSSTDNEGSPVSERMRNPLRLVQAPSHVVFTTSPTDRQKSPSVVLKASCSLDVYSRHVGRHGAGGVVCSVEGDVVAGGVVVTVVFGFIVVVTDGGGVVFGRQVQHSPAGIEPELVESSTKSSSFSEHSHSVRLSVTTTSPASSQCFIKQKSSASAHESVCTEQLKNELLSQMQL
jgi:hypothetical protein